MKVENFYCRSISLKGAFSVQKELKQVEKYPNAKGN